MTNHAPNKPFQSKLRPFAELIRQWRTQRKSYRKIARLLCEEHGLDVDHSTVFSFVKSRSRSRKVFAMVDTMPSPCTAVVTSPLTTESDSQSAIEELKHKPEPQDRKDLFDFNPDNPLTPLPSNI